MEGMRRVVNEPGGTGKMARLDNIMVCGKTGTVQNPHGEDHSVFFAFAPMKNPKIAIAVFVENAGWGGTWAAPIASLMIEKYLKGKVSDPERKAYLEASIAYQFRINAQSPPELFGALLTMFFWQRSAAYKAPSLFASSEYGRQLFWIICF
jgi:penicillin-binding protein 2